MDEAAVDERPAPPRAGRLWLRALVSIAAFAYLFATIDARAMLGALARLPLAHALGAEAFVLFALCVGAFRHRALLAAYGATRRPSFLVCLRLFFVGFFYNTFLPGSVAGDAVRAVGARESFGEDGTTASVAVVLVERVLGLLALVLVAGCAFAVHPLRGVEGLSTLVLVGVLAALVGVGLVAVARRLARFVPGLPGRLLARFPELVDRREFALAMLASLVSQLTVAVIGHVLIRGLAGAVPFRVSAVVVPIGAASAYVPITVSGLGVREAAFARLYELADVPASAAAAFSIAFLGVQLFAAILGGLLSWFDGRRA